MAQPPTPKEARRLFRTPRGSLSLAKTNDGTLVNGVEIPLKGDGYAFFSKIERRRTHFATRELARMIKRAARQVRKRYPGSVLGIGNVAHEEGGRVGESVSHQNGRDADLGMYALDPSGKRVNLRAFVSFGPDGWDKKRRYRYDTERNLALIEALMTDPQAAVQWLFLAEWLEERLIKLAWARGMDPKLIERMEEVLLQPGDSNPHSEHLHLRIYCSVQDRLHGCLERGPIRDWVDLGDTAWEERVARLARVLDMAERRWRKRALQALGSMRAIPAVPRILSLLDDPSKPIRKQALAAVRGMRDSWILGWVADRMRVEGRPKIAASLARILLRLGGDESDYVARVLLERPGWLLPHTLEDPKARAQIQRAAIRRLARTSDAGVAPLLVSLIGDPDLGDAAHEALLELTNQRISRKRAGSAWPRFLAAHGGDGWLEWMRRGFVAAGYRFDRPLGWESFDDLVAVIADRDRILSHNAMRALVRITGYDVDPKYRTRRNNRRLWRTWQRKYHRHFGPAGEARRSRGGLYSLHK